VNLDELRVFVAVAEELHFGRAARRLHLAQPPVSRSIRHLEHSLGAPLFVRSTRSVALTPVGTALLEPAREVLAAADRARRAVGEAVQGERGEVRLAFASASTQSFVSDIVRELSALAPHLTVSLTGLAYGARGLELLHQGDADIVFGRWDAVPEGIATALIVEERFVLAVPADHAFARRSSIAWTDLAGEPLVCLPDDSLLVQLTRRWSRDAGFEPHIVQVAPDTATVVALVRAGVGCSPTVETSLESVNHDDVVFLPFVPAPPAVEMRMAWRAAERNPAVRLTVDTVRAIVRRRRAGTDPSAASTASD
jgi:DNA-binding transcriptional LysR family regulator